MIKENKVSKYLLYAIGEIMLVVIGILIALQVNNWNQEQQLKKEGESILILLHEEFNENKALLEQTILWWRQAQIETDVLSKQCKSTHPIYSESQIDSIFTLVFSNPPYTPPQPVYEELINTSKLKLLEDDILKRKLFIWKEKKEFLKSRYDNTVKMIDEVITPYLYKNVSLKNWAVTEGYRNDKSIIPNRTMEIFKDLEFENMMEDRSYAINRGINAMEEMNVLIDEIIEITKSD